MVETVIVVAVIAGLVFRLLAWLVEEWPGGKQ